MCIRKYLNKIILCLFILLSLFNNNIYADENNIVLTGKCGENISFELNEAGELYLNGTGKMYDYFSSDGMDPSCPWYDYKDRIYKVIVNEGITYIGKSSFFDCYKLNKVSLSNSIEEIGAYAFMKCKLLNSIEFPSNLKILNQNAFEDTNLNSIVLPSSLEYLGAGVFDNCISLVSVYIEENLNQFSYSNNPFKGCISLEKIDVSENHTILKSIDGLLCSKDGKSLISYPSGKKDKNLNLSNEIIYIGQYALSYLLFLEKANLHEGIVSYDQGLFFHCDNLKEVILPSTLIQSKGYVGESCPNLRFIDNNSNLKCNVRYSQISDWINENNQHVDYSINEIIYQVANIREFYKIENIEISHNEVVYLDLGLLFNDGYSNLPKNFIYELSNNEIISIDSFGKLVGLKPGIASITLFNRNTGSEWKDISISIQIKVHESKVVYGDVNNNGIVNNQDRVILTRYLAKWNGYSINEKNADLNLDGKITAQDRVILTRYLAKWVGYETLPVIQ